MEKFTLRWSKDRDMYFVEPSRGRNVRGFYLSAEKHEFPVPPEIIKNPYSGAFAFDGYWRFWMSMRGFPPMVQSDPQLNVPASAELVRDYMTDAHLVTLEEAIQIAETNRIEAAAAARASELVRHRAFLLEQHHLRSEQPNPRPLPEREGEQEKSDPEAAAGFSSGGRPSRRDRRRGN